MFNHPQVKNPTHYCYGILDNGPAGLVLGSLFQRHFFMTIDRVRRCCRLPSVSWLSCVVVVYGVMVVLWCCTMGYIVYVSHSAEQVVAVSQEAKRIYMVPDMCGDSGTDEMKGNKAAPPPPKLKGRCMTGQLQPDTDLNGGDLGFGEITTNVEECCVSCPYLF